ncbi:MAG: response regulator [Acidobacteriota bacterium]|nr:response regulator [Acidobacteriota bacterium]
MMPGILVVCDDEVLLRTRAAVLDRTGAEVLSSRREHALALQQDTPCRLVLLCHSIPLSLRTDLTHHIRLHWPDTRILLVLPATSSTGEPYSPDFDDYVPCEPALLVERVCRLLNLPLPQAVRLPRTLFRSTPTPMLLRTHTPARENGVNPHSGLSGSFQRK